MQPSYDSNPMKLLVFQPGAKSPEAKPLQHDLQLG